MKSEEIMEILDSDCSDSQKVDQIGGGLIADFNRKRIPLTKCDHYRHERIPNAVKVFMTVSNGESYFEGAGYGASIRNGYVEEADCWAKAGMENTAETLRLMGDVYTFFENRRLEKRLDDHQADNYEVFLTDALGSIALLMETEHEKVLLEYVRKNANQFEF